MEKDRTETDSIAISEVKGTGVGNYQYEDKKVSYCGPTNID